MGGQLCLPLLPPPTRGTWALQLGARPGRKSQTFVWRARKPGKKHERGGALGYERFKELRSSV